MSKIKWNDSFSVNNVKLDTQHKKMLEIIEELHDSLTKDDAGDYHKVAEESLKAMMDYVHFHFREEEEYMWSIKYPGLSSHREIHTKLYTQTKYLFNDVMNGKPVLNTEIYKFLTNWLQDHILIEDKKFSIFAASEGRKKSCLTA